MPINTSLRIVPERKVASLAPKSAFTGPELRFSLLSTRWLPTPERSVVIPLTFLQQVQNPPATKIKFRFLSPSAHWTRLLFIGTLQTFSFYQPLQVIIGGCSCLCVTERLILVITTPLLWDLTRFRYDEHVVYPLTIQLRKLKSQNLVLIYTAEIINALGLFNHLEPMNRIDSNFRADGFVRSCFGEPQCQNIHREARKYQPRGINFESIEVWYKITEAFLAF